MRIRFAPGEGCEISGTSAELRAMAEEIGTLSDSISFAADTAPSPAPYPLALSSLVVRVGSGPVCATVRGETLGVIAGPEFLATFASCFQFEDSTPKHYHVHHEYFPGNTNVSPESVPLVICVVA